MLQVEDFNQNESIMNVMFSIENAINKNTNDIDDLNKQLYNFIRIAAFRRSEFIQLFEVTYENLFALTKSMNTNLVKLVLTIFYYALENTVYFTDNFSRLEPFIWVVINFYCSENQEINQVSALIIKQLIVFNSSEIFLILIEALKIDKAKWKVAQFVFTEVFNYISNGQMSHFENCIHWNSFFSLACYSFVACGDSIMLEDIFFGLISTYGKETTQKFLLQSDQYQRKIIYPSYEKVLKERFANIFNNNLN
jgi:hypothetical protein